MTTIVAVVLLLPLLVALPAGPEVFAGVSAVLALIALLDLSEMFAAAGVRPVLPAAVLPVAVVPLSALRGEGWASVPVALAGAFMLTIMAVLVFGRRARISEVVGTTMFTALLPSLGAGALVLLHALPNGTSWVVAVLLLSAAAEIGDPIARRLRRRHTRAGLDNAHMGGGLDGGGDPEQDAASSTQLVALVGAAAAVALTAAVLTALLPAEVPDSAVAGIALAAFAAARAGREGLTRLAGDAGLDTEFPGVRLGDGTAVVAVSTVLLAAPAAYVLAVAAG